MAQHNGKLCVVHALELMVLKCLYYPKQGTDSVQKLWNFQCWNLKEQPYNSYWTTKDTD